MAYVLWFGKFSGHSLEEIALGKKFNFPKGDEGYHYFYNLAHGEARYFGGFQRDSGAMNRWKEIHHKLNNFKAVYPCAVCGSDSPTQISVAGDGRSGYSMGRNYICCDKLDCERSLTCKTNDTMLYPLRFDTILRFGWGGGGTKFDEKEILGLMRELAGWKESRRMTAENATEFIDSLTLR